MTTGTTPTTKGPTLAERGKAVSMAVRDKKLLESEPFVHAMEILVVKFARMPTLTSLLDELRQGEERMDELVNGITGAQHDIDALKTRLSALKEQIGERELMIVAGAVDAKNDDQRKLVRAAARKSDPDLKTLIGQRDEAEALLRKNDGDLSVFTRSWTVQDHILKDRRAFLRLVLQGEE